jgi:hypothetical protein
MHRLPLDKEISLDRAVQTGYACLHRTAPHFTSSRSQNLEEGRQVVMYAVPRGHTLAFTRLDFSTFSQPPGLRACCCTNRPVQRGAAPAPRLGAPVPLDRRSYELHQD